MKNVSRFSLALAAAVAALGTAGFAQAQTTSGTSSTSSSSSMGSNSMFRPNSAYLGFNFGQSQFNLNNGAGGFAFDKRKNSYNIYGGAYFSEYLGAQIGYTDFDRVNRAGGSTYANGVTLSLVGRLPVATSFNLLGRLGTTYSRTDVSTSLASGITPGKESSWGTSYGVGAEYLFSPSWSGVLQYDEYRMKFAGTGRERVNVTSLGVRYTF